MKSNHKIPGSQHETGNPKSDFAKHPYINLAFRVTMSLVTLIAIGLLSYGYVYLWSMFETHSSSDNTYIFLNISKVVYLFATVILSVGAIWISSRSMLIAASAFLMPYFLVCAFVAFPFAIFPVLWTLFFVVAWSQYGRAARFRKPMKVLSPEEY